MMPFGYVCYTGHITFVHKYIDMVEVLPTYCFGSLRVKNESDMSQNSQKVIFLVGYL